MSLSAGRPSKANKKATLTDMADKPATVRVNFDLSREEHTKLKIYAAHRGQSLRQVLSGFIATLS